MKHPTNDRRSQRSQRLLGEAMVALMLEQPYDTITVGAIIERANVGRSTFYAHFYDKDDLLVSNLEAVFEDLGGRLSPAAGQDAILASLPLFEHIHGHRALYKGLVRSKSVDLVLKTIQAFLVRTIDQRVRAARRDRAWPALDGLPGSFWETALANELAGSFIAVLRWWLDNDLPHGPEHIDAIFRRLALPGPMALLADLG